MGPIIKLNVRTGDIIITETDLPFIEHFGVVVVEGNLVCVYHCTPSKNVTIDTLAAFLEGREYKAIRKTNATKEKIYARYKLAKGKQYHVVNYNCITFAEFLTG